jgi:hypothetical protein
MATNAHISKSSEPEQSEKNFFFSRLISSHTVFTCRTCRFHQILGSGNLGGFREPAHILVDLGNTIQLMTQPRQPLPRSKRKASEQAAPQHQLFVSQSSSLATNKALWIHGWGPMGVPSATHE